MTDLPKLPPRRLLDRHTLYGYTADDMRAYAAAAVAAATAREPVRLTDEQIDAIPCTDGSGSDWEALLRFARAVEAEVLRLNGLEVPR